MHKSSKRTKMKLHYLMDDLGRRTAVQISIQDWLAYQQEHVRLQQRTKLKKELTNAFKEIDDVRKGRRKALTMADVLNEL